MMNEPLHLRMWKHSVTQDGSDEWVSGSVERTRLRFSGARKSCPAKYGEPYRADPRRPVIMRAASMVTGSITQHV